MMRRALLVALLAVGLSGSVPVPAYAGPATDPAAAAKAGPPTVTARDIRFTPGRSLRYGSARDAGLLPGPIAALPGDVARYTQPSPTRPVYPGAVVLAARDGVIAAHSAMGYALRYADDAPTELPRDQWISMRDDTIFDLASVSKLFTALVAVQQAERGALDLDAPVTAYLPEFGGHGKDVITVKQLLTHTSGLRPDLPFYNYPTRDEQRAALFAETPRAAPGTAYIYSDLNLIALQFVLDRATGRSLDALVRDDITRPLGMTDTGYNPAASLRPRVAATEYEHVPPARVDRGLVWGTVHDENAWALGGVAGHAGVFSTARDLAVLAQTLLNGGRYGPARILSEAGVRLLFTDFNQAFPGDSHGLGFELDQRWYMDGLSSPVSAGHTGYTGTSLVIDPLSHSFAILLTNRVHPSRNWGSVNPARRAVARALARAVRVRPAAGRDAWFSQTADGTTATLTVPVPSGAATVSFDLWYDTEETDVAALEASSDGQAWTPVSLALRSGPYTWSANGAVAGFAGRRWASAEAALPAGTTRLRWRYTTDALYEGRGVYVDGVRIKDANDAVVFDGERARDAALFQADGWIRSAD
ncbi:MAG TPA: serine hydrolase [Streptosporangiaceae bacterium]|jgi:CubicO group peptidase (beta-lactamase class C family)|nr:serine hydrolase [Streptosporangiaceae bacterium]